jgi:site-specific recombinase XerD
MQGTAKNDESPHVPVPRIRERDYLRPDEANRVIAAADKRGRNPLRDTVLLRLMYRHGLRVAEVRDCKWSQFDLDNPGEKTFHVHRVKAGEDSKHTLDRDEVAGLRKLRQAVDGPLLFVSERGKALSPDMVARIVSEAAQSAGIQFHVYPHMLRHSTGYGLADMGIDTRLIQDFLGHVDIRNTVQYTKLSAKRLASVRLR